MTIVVRRIILGLIASAAMAVALPARAESWRSYYNDRFGVTADYPADWKMAPPPENNDGRIFESPDGTAQVIINGMHVLDAPSDELADRAKGYDGETITYTKKGPNWIVVSGTKGDRIFYRKSMLSCGDEVWNQVSIEYPAADKAKYDTLVAHVATSLKPGPGYEMKCR
jgi:hypothetical protein